MIENSCITVDKVFKKYCRGGTGDQMYGLGDLWREIVRRPALSELRKGEFWALQDVSINIRYGQSVALLGRNGSGKSTLLKILAGLIKLDKGRVSVNGRVQALINLGAGFNPRLTGRENIYNLSAVLGLSSQQTEGLMDEIIEFSELGDFIDQAVETYSSGMNARLGFSVMSHMEPDVLLIDEVLAVGDMAFQNKCKQHMEELKSKGVTMILVSHSMSSIRYFCDHAVWLHEGKVMDQGDVDKVCSAYETFMAGEMKPAPTATAATRSEPNENEQPKVEDTGGKGELYQFKYRDLVSAPIREKFEKQFIAVQTKDTLDLPPAELSLHNPVYDEKECVSDLRVSLLTHRESGEIQVNEAIHVVVEGVFHKPLKKGLIAVGFYDDRGLMVGFVNTSRGKEELKVSQGRFVWTAYVHRFKLAPGEYILTNAIMCGVAYYRRIPVGRIRVNSRSLAVENFLDHAGVHTVFADSDEESHFTITQDVLHSREDWT